MTPPSMESSHDPNCPLLTREDLRVALADAFQESSKNRVRKTDWSAVIMLIVAFAGSVLYISKVSAIDDLGKRMDRFEMKLDHLIERGMK